MTHTFIAAIETASGTSYMHPFHLGTDERVARSLVPDIFRQHQRRQPLRTVTLRRNGVVSDIWDGNENEWHTYLGLLA